ncbi:hypothetical protein JHK84_041956 [Glycine max]|nr:hypothetical protein JHK84_041956 [Glycine max]
MNAIQVFVNSKATPSSSPVIDPASPIRLVYCDENERFRMDPEAVATLQLVKELVGVVSVCGRARQGKKADLQCSNAVQSMEKRLRAACNASDSKIDNVAKVLDALLCEYEKSIQAPGKWQKLAVFLQQSLLVGDTSFEGPALDLTWRLINKVESDKSSLSLIIN